MSNRTPKDVQTVKGTNPQFLVEKIIRLRIYESKYWKEDCFGLTAELLVDKAMALDHIGGVFGGNIKPTPFLCLLLKMLQIQPHKDIVIEFIKNPEYKYIRILGAFYLRLIGTSVECYNYLEPLYNDYRKLKFKTRNGVYQVIHIDELVDELLHSERSCDIILPRIQKRYVLEQTEELEPRVSALDEDLSEVEEEVDSESESEVDDYYSGNMSRRRTHRRSRSRSGERWSPRRRRSRSISNSPRAHHSPSPNERRHRSSRRKRSRSRSRDRGRHHRRTRARSRSRSRSRSGSRRRSRSLSRDRHRRRERGHLRSPSPERKKSHKKTSSHKSHSSNRKGEGKLSKEEQEIKEANELREKLGMAPLRV